MKQLFPYLLTVAALCFGGVDLLAQNNGDLDDNFGSSGFVYTNYESDTAEYLMDVISLSNDKVLMVGYINHLYTDILVSRLNKNGSVDHTFGNNGHIVHKLIEKKSTRASAAMEMPDGKIIVVGRMYQSPGFDGFIMRLNSDGTLDKSFGEGSKGFTLFNAGDMDLCWPNDIDMHNGSLYVAARVSKGGDSDFGLFKFTQGGVLVPSFSSGGSTIVDIKGTDEPLSLDIDSNGHFVLAGVSSDNSGQYGTMLFLNHFGLIKSSFADKGKFIQQGNTKLNTLIDVAYDHAGRVVAVGSEGQNPDKNGVIIRFNTSGQLDESFSGDGIQSSDIGSQNGVYLNAVLIEEDNSIMALGYLYGQSYSDAYVLKLNENGNGHPDFGTKGDVNHPLPLDPSYLYMKAAARQSDGSVIIAGTTKVDGYDAFNMSAVKILNQESKSTAAIADRTFKSMSVYPNPANNRFSLSCQESLEKLRLFDMQGQIVAEWDGAHQSFELPDHVVSGSYVLRGSSAHTQYYSRLLIL